MSGQALTQTHPIPSSDGWLMSSPAKDGLRLSYSFDGREWVDLERSFLLPQVGGGGMLDAHLTRDDDGTFHLLWSPSSNSRSFGYAHSQDLESWSSPRLLTLAESIPGALTCAAPEAHPLPETGEFLVLWTTSVQEVAGAAPVRHIHFSITRDFTLWTVPAPLLDPGFDCRQATLLRLGSRWYAVCIKSSALSGQERGAAYIAVSDRAQGPYALLPGPIPGTEGGESPALVKLGKSILLYLDHPAEDRVAVLETADFHSWADVTQTTAIPMGQRHPSIAAADGSVIGYLRRCEPALIASVPKPALGGFTADPAIRAFGDAYYIYPTTDRPHWNTTEFVVWSSRNLVDWKREGVAMDVTRDLTWADLQAWAPDCVERDGTYFLYFCARGKIGVATSSSPAGPFRDALGKPLLQREGSIITNTIDPHVLIDDDGQAYLYFGNGDTLQVFRLGRDMLSVEGEPFTFKPRDFREGVVVFKRNGRYYFMWSIDDARSPDYRVGWGVADSPYGPIQSPEDERAFIVLKRNGRAIGTAHHSVVNVPGTDRWYVSYHRHAVPGGGGYKRETCIVRMEFDASGAILPMDPLTTPFKQGDEGEPLINGRGRPG